MIDKKILLELDFYKTLSLIKDFTSSSATKKAIEAISPFDEFEEASRTLKEFEEMQEGRSLNILSFPDISELIERSKKEGVIFEPAELTQFLKVLEVLENISSSVEELLNFSFLSQRIKTILGTNLSIGNPKLLEILENTVDEEGNILDSASSYLKYIRKQIKKH